MWKESDKKLVLRLESSSTLFFLLLLMHLGAWVSLLIVPMPWHVKALLVFAVGISLRESLTTHALRKGADAVVAIELQKDQCALRRDAKAQWIPCTLVGHFVHTWIVVLRLRVEGRRRLITVVVLRGTVDETAFRYLRVSLNTISP